MFEINTARNNIICSSNTTLTSNGCGVEFTDRKRISERSGCEQRRGPENGRRPDLAPAPGASACPWPLGDGGPPVHNS